MEDPNTLPSWAQATAAWVAVGLSILGVWQARKAANKATDAAKIATDAANRCKQQLVIHRQVGDLTDLNAKLTQATSVMAKYGSGHHISVLAGIVIENDTKVVQTFVSSFRQDRELLPKENLNKMDRLCDQLDSLLSELVSQRKEDLDEVKVRGKAIYDKLDTFASLLKKQLNDKKETVN